MAWSVPLLDGQRSLLIEGKQVPALEPAAQAVAILASNALQRVEIEEKASRAGVDAETERVRSAVLSSVSHDLRTPLASILGAATTLTEEGTPAEAKVELARSIEEESRRLARQLDNLLQMTVVQGGALKLAREWVPPSELLGAALASLGRPVEKVQLRMDATPLVDADPGAVETVLLNLLSNALAVSQEVSVDSRVDEDGWTVRVLDRGPGFPSDDLERVFEKFYRGQTATSRGTGLGLAIVRALVRAHGGRTWACNRLDGGAEVGFCIPMGEAPTEVPEAIDE